MTKKDQLQAELKEKVKEGIKPSHLKKSKSLESLTAKSLTSLEVKELQAQITALLEQISRIKQETNQSLQAQEQVIKELTTEKNKLTDSNNELRTIEPVNSESRENSFDYGTWIRMGSLALLIYLLSRNKEN